MTSKIIRLYLKINKVQARKMTRISRWEKRSEDTNIVLGSRYKQDIDNDSKP